MGNEPLMIFSGLFRRQGKLISFPPTLTSLYVQKCSVLCLSRNIKTTVKLYWKEQKQESLQGCLLSGARYTVIVSYRLMYMNQVLENYYLYTRQIKH